MKKNKINKQIKQINTEKLSKDKKKKTSLINLFFFLFK